MSNNAETQGAIGGAESGAATGTSIAPGWGTLIGGIVGAGVGALGGAGVDSAMGNRANVVNEYMSQLQNLDMPRYEDLKRAYQQYSTGQQLTPAQLNALQQADSEITKLQQNKVAQNAQMQALSALQARSRTGLTLQDQAALLQAQEGINRQQAGAQNAIQQNMAARGMGGGGAELAARLASTQNGAQLAAQNSLGIAGQAQQNAIQAIKDSAAQGRQIGQDQLNLDTMKAQAVDATRQANLQRLQQAMQYNVGQQNQANMYNTQRSNNVSDMNTQLGNRQQDVNKDLLMTDYNNQVNRLNGIYGAKIGQANSNVSNAQNQQAGYSGLLNSAGGLIAGIANPKTSGTGNNFNFNLGGNSGLDASGNVLPNATSTAADSFGTNTKQPTLGNGNYNMFNSDGQ